MYTTSNPKSLTDLCSQDNVIIAKQGEAPETIANRFFNELFHPTSPVSINFLFEEDNKRVYEAYQDSGSIDYLYIIV